MFNQKDIKQFWKVRRQLERLSKNTRGIDEIDLEGGCMIGAFLIHCYLKEKRYNSTLVVCAGHCYTQVGDWIVDVTATQFNINKKVLIEKELRYKQVIKSKYPAWIFEDKIRLKQIKRLPSILHKMYWEPDPIKILSLPKTMYYDS